MPAGVEAETPPSPRTGSDLAGFADARRTSLTRDGAVVSESTGAKYPTWPAAMDLSDGKLIADLPDARGSGIRRGHGAASITIRRPGLNETTRRGKP
jgi:hypothetical protein